MHRWEQRLEDEQTQGHLILQLSMNEPLGKLLDMISLDVFTCIMGAEQAGRHSDGELQVDISALAPTEVASGQVSSLPEPRWSYL